MSTEEKAIIDVYSKMAHICSRTEQCSSDIRKKIIALGMKSEVADEIIEKLVNENFINDGRYINAYVNEKLRINNWGRVKMRYYLRIKGLPDDLIKEGLEEINEETYKEVLIKTLKEKSKSVKKKNKFEKMGQIIRFAQSRGFEPELIHRHINEVLK